MLSLEGLQQRSQLLQAIRLFFLERDYLEVDTPLRLPVLLPEANIFPVTSDGCFLQTSPELCMKRLLAHGCERIFQICPCFRKDELGRLHQPEFTMLEWYHKKWSYRELMEECEAMIRWLAGKLYFLPGVVDGGKALSVQGATIDLTSPWPRLTVADAFSRYAGKSAEEALACNRFDEILVTEVERHLGRPHPTFLCDYPAALGSLARRSPAHPEVAERFELYMGGVEIANGFSELADAAEQRARFAQEITTISAGGGTADMPEKFLADLPGMGECAGIALGVDRLFMLLRGQRDIASARSFLFTDL